MLQAFYNEEAVTVGGDTYRLVINFRTIDAIEGLVGRDFDSLLTEIVNPATKVPVGTQAKIVWGLLREHHPEVSIDQVMSLIYDPEGGLAAGVAMSKLIAAAFKLADEEPKEKGKNPRKPRGASKTS